jgi:carboxyl-terminal processing protease
MNNSNFSKGAVVFWFVCFGTLLGVGAWQARLQARAPRDTSPLVVSGTNAKGAVLNCEQVRSRIGQFLDIHYLFRSFDQKLSERTFDRTFEVLDPAHLYFVESDIKAFEPNRSKLHELVSQKKCDFIDEVFAKYKELVTERTAKVQEVLKGPFDFEADEVLSTGTPKLLADRAQLDEQWRKRLKFQVMNFMGTESEEKARERLQKRYSLQLESLKSQTTDDAYSNFLNAFATAMDPHSSHFLPEDQEDFNIRLGNRLEGIGATLKEEDGYISVTALVAGGAAERDGRLQIGDKIVAVDPGGAVPGWTDVVDMDLSKAVRLIRGPKGTTVKLLLLRKTEDGSKRLNIEIVRDSVMLTASRAKGGVLELNGRKVGIVRLPSFYTDFNCRARNVTTCNGAASDVLQEIEKLSQQKVEGIVLDLRNNGGGDLQESILLSGLFIPEGPVVQTVDRRRVSRSLDDEDSKVYYSGPLVVYINKYSASASEIVSGALQDYGRAVIVGDDHTFGKATVQIIQELSGTQGRSSDGALKVTQSKFYRPSGKSNQVAGVESDIVIPSLLSATDLGERENKLALEQDRTKPAPEFAPLEDLSSKISDLKTRSAERIKASADFAKLEERVQKLREQEQRATVSLKSRQSESREAEEEQKKDEAESAAAEPKAFLSKDFALREAAQILLDTADLQSQSTASAKQQTP